MSWYSQFHQCHMFFIQFLHTVRHEVSCSVWDETTPQQWPCAASHSVAVSREDKCLYSCKQDRTSDKAALGFLYKGLSWLWVIRSMCFPNTLLLLPAFCLAAVMTVILAFSCHSYKQDCTVQRRKSHLHFPCFFFLSFFFLHFWAPWRAQQISR